MYPSQLNFETTLSMLSASSRADQLRERFGVEDLSQLQAAAPAIGEEVAGFSSPARVPNSPSILSTGNVAYDSSTRWWGGLTFTPDICCGGTGTWVECNYDGQATPQSKLDKPKGISKATPFSVEPFVVVTRVGCGAIGRESWPEAYAEAIDLQRRMLPQTIMRVLMHGGVDGQVPGGLGQVSSINGAAPVFTSNPYMSAPLASATQDLTPASGPVSPEVGAMLLSAFLTCCKPGFSGLIVGKPLVFEMAAKEHALVASSNGVLYRTHGGHFALGSCGFDGRKPGEVDAASNPAGVSYMYAIGLPSIRLSPPWSMSEMARQQGHVASDGWPIGAFNRQTNIKEAMVETTVAATFDPCCRAVIAVKAGA